MFKFKSLISTVLLLIAVCFHTSVAAQSPQLEIELTLPELDVQPYHRPYVAVWLETPERKHVTTLALWVQKAK